LNKASPKFAVKTYLGSRKLVACMEIAGALRVGFLPTSTQPGFGAGFTRERYDLFGHIRFDVAKGGEATLDAVRDMRRYLLLAEAYMLETGLEMPKDRDNLEADKFQANLDKVRRQLEKPGFCLGPRGFDELLDTRPE